jgi:hypothetical protein
MPMPIFKTGIKQRVFVLSLEEQLHKEFDLNLLQRQSANWASMCCGIDIGLLVKGIDRALQQRKMRKIREQVTRELTELEAARKAATADVK